LFDRNGQLCRHGKSVTLVFQEQAAFEVVLRCLSSAICRTRFARLEIGVRSFQRPAFDGPDLS